MQGDTVVFFPKYTTVTGDKVVDYYSDPYDVTRFNQIDLEYVYGGDTTGAASITLEVQESSDLETWTTVIGTGQTISAAAPRLTDTASNTLRYVRVVVTALANTTDVVTFWVKGVARNT